MEPPDAVKSKVFVQSVVLDIYLPNNVHVQHIFTVQQILRLRGSGLQNPNTDDKSAEIPYLTREKFQWNGLPRTEFREHIILPIQNGLATMTVNGYSLLDTCNQTDAGGVFGNPPRATASAQIIAESDHRNQKAFA